ncbi:feline leukemia virus subgroup C receptor-related protein 2-like [Neodiprion virginianus]|uniref:feline leukemia virus subgroup C receptor-related protein 2-like n=1 Tax=Neodiprion virginianus TaxID=2961670 RepID=UPI001EE6A0AC|nr:feline leukemia virus subgroup C receptor-related protein 2-like [Neodiprion virginianus]
MVSMDEDPRAREFLTTYNGAKITPIANRDKSSLSEKDVEKTRKAEEDATGAKIELKVYKRRWLQLGLFFIYALSNDPHWTQFSSIGKTISRYYSVSPTTVSWTSSILQVTYVVMIMPVCCMIDRVGLRWACLIGSIGISIGSWIIFWSLSPDRFVTVVLGQLVITFSQVFSLTGPVKLVALWFGPNQVATATSIAFFGGPLGIGLSFFVTRMILRNHDNVEDIGRELSPVFLSAAAFSTVVTIALFFFFQDEPLVPPSRATALQVTHSKVEDTRFWSTVKRVMTNKSFFAVWNTYGMGYGLFSTMCYMLNPYFLDHFENGEEDVGRLGILVVIAGYFCSLTFGIILDKTKQFKELGVFVYIFLLVGEILFAVGLRMEIRWLMLTGFMIFGLFAASYGSLGFELVGEVVYPELEDAYAGLLMFGNQLYGGIFSVIISSLLQNYGEIVVHGFAIAVLSLGLATSGFTEIELKRQNVEKHPNEGYNVDTPLKPLKS